MTRRLLHRFPNFAYCNFQRLKIAGPEPRRINSMFHSYRRFEPFQLRVLDSEPSETLLVLRCNRWWNCGLGQLGSF